MVLNRMYRMENESQGEIGWSSKDGVKPVIQYVCVCQWYMSYSVRISK